MHNKKRRIGITLRVVKSQTYDEKRDALSQDWPAFLEKIDIIPIYLPNKFSDIKSYVKELELDGIIISGGDNIGDNPERDNTEKKLIEICMQAKKPIFGVCRGMQVLNRFFGGETVKNINSDHVNKRHDIALDEMFSKAFQKQSVNVNSFHNNIITQNNLGENLVSFATVNDGTVEGFYHRDLPIIGVMWHPERDSNSFNLEFVKKFFNKRDFLGQN